MRDGRRVAAVIQLRHNGREHTERVRRGVIPARETNCGSKSAGRAEERRDCGYYRQRVKNAGAFAVCR